LQDTGRFGLRVTENFDEGSLAMLQDYDVVILNYSSRSAAGGRATRSLGYLASGTVRWRRAIPDRLPMIKNQHSYMGWQASALAKADFAA